MTNKKPSAPPSFKYKISKSKVDTVNYYTTLAKINKIAKALSPDGKLYGNFQIEAGKMFDNFKLKQEDKKNKKFKKETLAFLDKAVNKKTHKKPGTMPQKKAKKKKSFREKFLERPKPGKKKESKKYKLLKD
tara:strand:+ start:88 stop:483 length:396 start_codon:yes stop_codon:yes gene_type:complete